MIVTVALQQRTICSVRRGENQLWPIRQLVRDTSPSHDDSRDFEANPSFPETHILTPKEVIQLVNLAPQLGQMVQQMAVGEALGILGSGH